MNDLKELILERSYFLETLICEKRKMIEKAPKGIINVAHSGKREQYYYKHNSKDKKRKYLRKSEAPVIEAICQREYDEQVVERAEKERARLRQLLALYEKGTCEELFEKLKDERKRFVDSLFDIFDRAKVDSLVDIMENKKLILHLIMESRELEDVDRKILRDLLGVFLNCFKDVKIEEIKSLFDKK